MSAHTPGPWRWEANANGGARVETLSVGIAQVLSRAGVAHPVQDTCEANARLIAAAPELLAALEAVMAIAAGLDEFMDGAEGTDARRAAEDAIAKARGGK